ncbi:MAG TPA: hypothetical protein VEJ63_07750 [Planctomycetota bacterium]|nr:hypothetical protein [Planctomycetota bacterium]
MVCHHPPSLAIRFLPLNVLALLAVASAFSAETWTISTIAGGNLGDGGPASAAGINGPNGLCFDSGGNLYFADHFNNRIRKIATDGTISTFCGGSVTAHNDGTTATAGFAWPANLCFDEAGNMFIAEQGIHRIRKVDTNGNVTRIAGFTTPGYSGDNGAAIDATLNTPSSVVARNGKLYVADSANHCIRLIENGTITTIAGNGTAGFAGDGGAPASAQLNYPWFVLLDADNNLLIAESGNFRVRKIDFAANKITTIAGNGTGGVESGDGGAPTSASFYDCTGLALDAGGDLYIATRRRIRKVSGNVITTVVGEGVNSEWPQCIAFNAAGEMLYTDVQHCRIRKRAADGTITTIAGNAFGNGGPASDALFALVSNVAADSAGNVYLADWYDFTVRKIDTAGIISVFAGSHVDGNSGDGGPATLARMYEVTDVAVDASGNVYIADAGNQRIRKVNAAGTISTLASGIPYCVGLTVDSSGNVYATGAFSQRVYKITPGGSVSVLAGSGVAGFADGAANSAQFSRPQGIAVDGSGNVYVADAVNKRIRKIAGGVVSTIVSGLSRPTDVAVDSAGDLYIADPSAKKRFSSIQPQTGCKSSAERACSARAATAGRRPRPRWATLGGCGSIHKATCCMSSIAACSACES